MNTYGTSSLIMKWLLVVLASCFLSCGYGFVHLQNALPGGIKRISIPTFQNHTHESGLENKFTSDLRNEFFKSKIIEVVSRDEAEAEIQGVITAVSAESSAHSEKDLGGRASILANQYNAKIEVSISLVRLSDKKVLWQRTLSDTRQYLTSEDILKNEAKQEEAFNKISVYLMEQTHDLMLEDF